MEAFICLKCLNALLNYDPNKVKKLWKKHKISLCSKYSEGHFKKLQRPLAAGALIFVHAGRKLAHKSGFHSLSSPRLCTSVSHATSLSVVRPVLPSPAPLWNPRGLCWRVQNDILPPLPPLREDNHHPGEWGCSALIRTSGQIEGSSQVDFLNKQPYTQLFSRLPGYCTFSHEKSQLTPPISVIFFGFLQPFEALPFIKIFYWCLI